MITQVTRTDQSNLYGEATQATIIDTQISTSDKGIGNAPFIVQAVCPSIRGFNLVAEPPDIFQIYGIHKVDLNSH